MKKRKSERGREIEKERATHRTIYANNEPDFFLSFFIYFFFPLHYKKKKNVFLLSLLNWMTVIHDHMHTINVQRRTIDIYTHIFANAIRVHTGKPLT